MIENCPVTGIQVRADDLGVKRVRAVETPHGTIETPCVVNCAGQKILSKKLEFTKLRLMKMFVLLYKSINFFNLCPLVFEQALGLPSWAKWPG